MKLTERPFAGVRLHEDEWSGDFLVRGAAVIAAIVHAVVAAQQKQRLLLRVLKRRQTRLRNQSGTISTTQFEKKT